MTTRVRMAAVAAAFLVAVAPAAAQDGPKVELGLGYSYLHDDSLDTGLPKGFVVSVAGQATRWLGVVGEIGGNAKSVRVGSGDVTVSVYSFMIGPRISTPVGAAVGLFGQLLIGAAHGSIEIGVPNASLFFSGTNLAVQPGVGLDLNFSPSAGIRFQGDVRGIRNDPGDTVREQRFVVALVIRP